MAAHVLANSFTAHEPPSVPPAAAHHTRPSALKALKNNDIYTIADMHNVNKKLYTMREYVDERKWTSDREESGEQAMATAVDGITNHATCEALLGNLVEMHDEMPELMNYIDEAHE